jgi:hypothetical protein
MCDSGVLLLDVFCGAADEHEPQGTLPATLISCWQVIKEYNAWPGYRALFLSAVLDLSLTR